MATLLTSSGSSVLAKGYFMALTLDLHQGPYPNCGCVFRWIFISTQCP